jgi:hypothetical protein
VSRVQTHSTRVLSALLVLLGIAVFVSTIARGGGPLSIGVVMGLALVAFGAGRLYLSGMMRDDR